MNEIRVNTKLFNSLVCKCSYIVLILVLLLLPRSSLFDVFSSLLISIAVLLSLIHFQLTRKLYKIPTNVLPTDLIGFKTESKRKHMDHDLELGELIGRFYKWDLIARCKEYFFYALESIR